MDEERKKRPWSRAKVIQDVSNSNDSDDGASTTVTKTDDANRNSGHGENGKDRFVANRRVR